MVSGGPTNLNRAEVASWLRHASRQERQPCSLAVHAENSVPAAEAWEDKTARRVPTAGQYLGRERVGDFQGDE